MNADQKSEYTGVVVMALENELTDEDWNAIGRMHPTEFAAFILVVAKAKAVVAARAPCPTE